MEAKHRPDDRRYMSYEVRAIDEGGTVQAATLNIGSVTMPAGDYWVGDPCYAIQDHEQWMAWLEETGYKDDPRYLVASFMGRSALGIGTAHGDGEFEDRQGNRYPVDAGLIGCVPVESLPIKGPEPFGMHRMTFPRDFTCSYDEGTIHIGHIAIDTDPREYFEDGDTWN